MIFTRAFNEHSKVGFIECPLPVFTTSRLGNRSAASNNVPSPVPDERLLSRQVAARLDLPVAQRLLNQNYKSAVIKRCCEDQLRLRSK